MVLILNLNDIKKDILKLNKKDSCSLYNESINNINNNCISTGLKFLKQARDLNPDDVDILNLTGLVNLLKCNFDDAVESFYKSSLCEKTALCEKYINMLTSEEFLIFFEKYNQLIRLINKGMYKEAIQGFKLITDQYCDLIEPYELLALLYDKEEEYIKFDECLEVLKIIDKENYLLNQENNTLDMYNSANIQTKSNIKVDDYKNEFLHKSSSNHKINDYNDVTKEKSSSKNQKSSDSNKKKSIKKNKYLYIAIILGILLVGQSIYSSYKMNNLTDKISKNNETKNEESIDSNLTKKENNIEENEDMSKASNINKSNKNINKEDDVKSKKNTVENEDDKDSDLFTEDELMSKANTLKSEKKTKPSIQLYKKVADIGENKGNTSEATYQVAILSEKLKDYKTAEEYYKMYVENYSEKDAYFDESYYNLGMMYYNNGDLKNSKLTLKKLVNKVPNSMYNNSKVKEILKEE
ncbi:TPA: tetratricopeptide repeat protein [Clostridioides difficile]|uniref:tetratricopeptide repeat protein n=1 Tax=Clostridioides difficile TaxID=1496 RepID=UPI001C1B2A17|nr:tetratricopeptide repeat protein [Clostridioides difficile]EKG0824843.1 tetratricopeptide repeat protein [Clostridioides difficile]EKJ1269518.1 tetratricopeptide repeat protein [Clostridioides difficile]MDL0187946.1 tetratricopeptide repeat protein [Clostridioides difficile]MDL0190182.1 tetratricopeptide repeat protein [Clostridioides difficile]HBF2211556.1 tetratricopeptide repeat protein [Clostridioides difficile]